MSKYDYLVHRCPQCNSNQVGNLTVKPKSGFQKGAEFVGGALEGWYGGDGSITDSISNFIYDPEKQNRFYCKECKHAWKNPNMVDETPIEVLEAEKERRIRSIRSGLFFQIIFMIGCVAATVWLFYYLWVNDFRYYETMNKWWGEGTVQVAYYHWSWLFMGILFLGVLGFTCYIIGSTMESFEDLKKLKSMSAEQFRKSRLRI